MKKFYLIATGIITILVFLISNAFGQWQFDNEYDFKINVPTSWSKNSYIDGTDKVYDFYSPDENAAVQIRAFEAPQGLTMDLLVNVYEEQMLPAGTSREELKYHTSKSGIPGKQATYRLNYNGTMVAMGVFYAIQNGKGYVVSAIIPISMLQRKTAQVKSITQSFSLLSSNNGSGNQSLRGATMISSFKITNITLCSQLGHNNSPISPATTFNTQTPEIHAVINFTGMTKKDLVVSWVYINWNRTITEDAYNFTDNGGVGVVSLSKPNNGWPVGSYKIVFKLDGNLIDTKTFEIVDNNAGSGLSGLSGSTGSENYVTCSGGKVNGTFKFSKSGSYPIKNQQTVVIRGLDNNGTNALEIYLYNLKGTGPFKYGSAQSGSPSFVIGAVDGKSVSSDYSSGSGQLTVTEYREGGKIKGTFSAKVGGHDIKGSFSLPLSTPKMPGGY